MSARLADKDYTAGIKLFPITKGVPSFGGTQFLTAFSAGGFVGTSELSAASGGFTVSNATTNISFGCTYYAGAAEYEAKFVAEVLAADAAEPEASFNNVVDLLGWLNRE